MEERNSCFSAQGLWSSEKHSNIEAIEVPCSPIGGCDEPILLYPRWVSRLP